MKNLIYLVYSILFILIIQFFTFFSYSFWDDILTEAFDPSDTAGTIIDLWDSKKDVWNSVLKEAKWFSWWQWFYEKAPLIVKIVKIILKMTVVLSISMVIFCSLKFMIQVFNWNDYKSASAKKDLINIFIWLLIALFSITAIKLIISIPKSTLNDISYQNNIL